MTPSQQSKLFVRFNVEFKSSVDVTLIQSMGSDAMLASAAWVSTSAQQGLRRAVENPDDVRGVINYLIKHRHGTPFEHSAMTFCVKAPIFVWREWHRHRIGFSYNEESARYKQLDPVFYIPARDRPMVKVDGWKPGRPKFLTLDQSMALVTDMEHFGDIAEAAADQKYDEIVSDMKQGYKDEYARYERQLSRQLDPGLARDCLPVGIYSSCWVTCNPRSLMSFLSLRVGSEEATFRSYPLHEIELGALACEEMFKQGWPITHAAFVLNGRVAP
ncbi:FAD-dependent thymidylate synthase [Fimbriiglobus ruber]|uniref:FAD-dependent thymidylate synthase n=1 Tax=Fimbriiglobus ruber TaxID=1908690 RepID=A0A225CYC6_9BACT|nr:FAD-dependent thymidylate synthase [Fimbriiglobus ruber]OWK34341.1 Thymidylate synthase thyX [Fimbriiglobus ruber]